MEGEYLVADGFDKAIIGIEMESQKVVYDKYLMCEVLMEEEGMSEEEAIDFLSYNVWYAYVGEHTPIYIDGMNADHLREFLSENS